jgi:hypothetical protein
MLANRADASRARLVTALAVCAGVALLGISSLNNEGSSQRTIALPNIGTDQPIGGQVVTLDKAAQVMPFSIYRPQDSVASDSTISQVLVWLPGPDTQATLRIEYTSGVVVTLTQWPAGQDPAQSYTSQWEETGGLGTLTTINDHPAWVLPGNATTTRQVPSSPGTTFVSGVADPSTNTVELTIANVDILIKGRQSIDAIVQAANTVS